jgi:hypothetical protein
MKLYGLKEGAILQGSFFDKKADAKKKRNELNGGTPAELAKAEKKLQFTVTLGPDHPKYKANRPRADE